MSKFDDLTGRQFGKLRVLERAPNDLWGGTCFYCVCKCGCRVVVNAGRLRRGQKSCGCKEVQYLGIWARRHKGERSPSFKHGEAGRYGKTRVTKEYACWFQLRQRCRDSRHSRFTDYGGRGIRVCKRWLGKRGYMNFLKDMGRAPSSKHTIDRKNNDGNYTPSNCRWATWKMQNRNQRRAA